MGKEVRPLSVSAVKDFFKETEQSGITGEVELGVGSRIEVYWQLDNNYYPVTIAKYDEERKKHIVESEDCKGETLSLSGQKWRPPKPSVTLHTTLEKLGSIVNIPRYAPSPQNVHVVVVQDPLDIRFEKFSKK